MTQARSANPNKIKQYHENLLTDIYTELNILKAEIKQEEDTSWKWEVGKGGTMIGTKMTGSGDAKRIWKVTEDTQYGTTTWKLHGSKNDKEKGWVGTDGQLIIRESNNNAYTYVTTEDIEDRAKLLFETIEWLLRRNKYGLDLKFAKLIENEKKVFLNKPKEWALDVNNMRNIATRVSYFNEKFPQAKKDIEQTLVDLSWILNKMNPKISIHEWQKIIAEEEKNYIFEVGRPNVINIASIADKNKHPAHRISVISAQLTQGNKTKPSTKRGVYANDNTIPNHVNDIKASIIQVEENGQNKEKVQVDYSLISHASHSHFKEKDRCKRRIANKGDVITEITAMLNNIYKADKTLGDKGSLTNPIDISYSLMVLLTSKQGSRRERTMLKVAGVDKYESEFRQLKDICIATETLRCSKQPLYIVGDNYAGYVTFDPTYMNIPVNAGKKMQQIADNSLQKGINARGFVEYNENIKKYCVKFMQENPDKWDINNAQFKKRELTNRTATGLLNSVIRQSNDYVHFDNLMPGFKEKVESQKQLIQDKIDANSKKLTDFVTKLQAIETALAKDPNNNNLKKFYLTTENEFYKKLKENFYRYQKINRIEKKAVSAMEQKATYLKEDLEKLLKSLPDNPKNDTKDQKNIREFVLIMQRHLVCQDFFYNKKYQHKSNAYQFNSLYLLNNKNINREIGAICKSSEDRTGWQRVMLASYTVFEELYGRPPNLESLSDKKTFDEIIIQKIHEMSASLNNTKFNSQAIGLQVSPNTTNKMIGVEIGYQSARLAKQIFQDLDRYEPSFEVKQQWQKFADTKHHSSTALVNSAMHVKPSPMRTPIVNEQNIKPASKENDKKDFPEEKNKTDAEEEKKPYVLRH